MKLSVFTTITNPILRGDNLDDALECYKELADEVIIVNGTSSAPSSKPSFMDPRIWDKTLSTVYSEWSKEFSWDFIGQQFQRGYNACTGDIVIHADLDFIWHERDFDQIRKKAQHMLDHSLPAMSMWKYQFVQPDRYNLKSRLVTMVNKRDYSDRIKFNSGGDLCQPSLDGIELSPNDMQQAEVPIYNYEKMLKTKEQIANDQGRMERAWHKYFGTYQMKSDGTDEGALARWIEAQIGKYNKPQKEINITDHPKYVQKTIINLKPENWGYNAFGNLKQNNYVPQ